MLAYIRMSFFLAFVVCSTKVCGGAWLNASCTVSNVSRHKVEISWNVALENPKLFCLVTFSSTSLKLQAYDWHEIICQACWILYARKIGTCGQSFNHRLFELQILDKDCEQDCEMLCQKTTWQTACHIFSTLVTIDLCYSHKVLLNHYTIFKHLFKHSFQDNYFASCACVN